MTSRFDKNFTESGYTMNYSKLQESGHFKTHVLQFRIEIQGIFPPIWRRIQVPANYNFWDLHVAIQDALGWQDYHLHHFEIKGKGKRKAERIGIPDFSGSGDLPEVFPGWEILATTYFNDFGIQATYEYDYGDGWLHQVMLEGYLYRDPKIKYPVCIEGERACPPEDCGGVHGYENVLEMLANPEHEEHEEMSVWVGEDWDPEKFNPDTVKFDNPYKRWVYAFLKD
ncbi:MAG: plasmid pRiA4b ORF-3 family protein [Prolixibacteraceae bacterium]|nr:plasmid pRiA4b ORF-3 family protein [Prolixibacteraceae bacterium]